jgi:hypothetical protein
MVHEGESGRGEVVSTAVFLVFLYAVARYEIIHLLAR